MIGKFSEDEAHSTSEKMMRGRPFKQGGRQLERPLPAFSLGWAAGPHAPLQRRQFVVMLPFFDGLSMFQELISGNFGIY